MALSAREQLPSVLLTGPSGSGRRTIAEGIANRLAIEFFEISLKEPPDSVSDLLFGTDAQAGRSEFGFAPGLLGRSEPAVVYLAELQLLDPVLHERVYQLVRYRRYFDKRGYKWELSEDLWLIGSQTLATPDASVGPDNRLYAAFEFSVSVTPPTSEEDLFVVCRSIASQHPFPRMVETDLGRFLSSQQSNPENLLAIRRWMVRALENTQRDRAVTIEALRDAMQDDLKWILPQLIYRGTPVTPKQFHSWAEQFPLHLSQVPAHLVRQIALNYYLSQRSYFEALQQLIRDSQIGTQDRVVFCKWQRIGTSAPSVAHDLKNLAHWSVVGDMDLGLPEEAWPPELQRTRWFVFADDFVGSGRTLAGLVSEKLGRLPRILEKYPAAEARILVVAAFENGIREARKALPKPLAHRVRIIAWKIYEDEDTCFHQRSKILGDTRLRENFQAFCWETAKKHFPGMRPRMRLGFRNTGAIIVFFNTVPNNTLPILWHTTGTWSPLFPASGLLTD
jgi:hypothetical protein